MANTVSAISGDLSKAIERASSLSGLAPSKQVGSVADVEGFGALLAQELGKVTASAGSAQQAIEAYSADPEGVPLERVALLMAKAETDLKFAAQVRNKAVSAYQEIMGMQL